MNNSFLLTLSISKAIVREKTIIFLVIFLPVVLVTAGALSAPDRLVDIVLDDTVINPAPSTIEISVALYSLTAVVLTTSVVSFFIRFELKNVIPRLKQAQYSNLEIVLAFLLVVIILNFIISFSVSLISLIWLDVNSYVGFLTSLLLSSIIFSTIGLIIAELVDSLSLGLYSILSLSVLDTAFLENPIFSRRYNEPLVKFMPAHESTEMMMRTVFETGTDWWSNLPFIVVYEIVLIVIFLSFSLYKKV